MRVTSLILKWTFFAETIWNFYNFIGSRVSCIDIRLMVGLTQILFDQAWHGVVWSFAALFCNQSHSVLHQVLGWWRHVTSSEITCHVTVGERVSISIFRVITLHHSGWTPATFGSQSFVPISVNFKSVILTAVVNFSCIALISVALIAALLWICGVYAKAFCSRSREVCLCWDSKWQLSRPWPLQWWSLIWPMWPQTSKRQETTCHLPSCHFPSNINLHLSVDVKRSVCWWRHLASLWIGDFQSRDKRLAQDFFMFIFFAMLLFWLWKFCWWSFAIDLNVTSRSRWFFECGGWLPNVWLHFDCGWVAQPPSSATSHECLPGRLCCMHFWGFGPVENWMKLWFLVMIIFINHIHDDGKDYENMMCGDTIDLMIMGLCARELQFQKLQWHSSKQSLRRSKRSRLSCRDWNGSVWRSPSLMTRLSLFEKVWIWKGIESEKRIKSFH